MNKLVNSQMMLEFLLLMIQFSPKEVKRSLKNQKKKVICFLRAKHSKEVWWLHCLVQAIVFFIMDLTILEIFTLRVITIDVSPFN